MELEGTVLPDQTAEVCDETGQTAAELRRAAVRPRSFRTIRSLRLSTNL